MSLTRRSCGYARWQFWFTAMKGPDRCLQKAEYIRINRRLYRALVPDFVEAECAQSAEVRGIMWNRNHTNNKHVTLTVTV